MLNHYNRYGHVNLSSVQWAGGVQLKGHDLQKADLGFANLKEADLRGAYLRGAKFDEYTKFNEKTVLPDAQYVDDEDENPIYNKYWTPETDMSRYTNPEHPDFWEPEYLKPNHNLLDYQVPPWARDRHGKGDGE